jgi:ribose 5-phosphate isomerase A
VAAAARRFVVIADRSKKVEVLGRFPLPVEVVQFGWELTARRVAPVVGVEPALRREPGGGPFVTDNGNYILDCRCGEIPDPARTERELKLLAGVVESGLFVRLAHSAVLGDEEGVEIVGP